MTNNNPKTWFITGASRGFGRQWTVAALERGDRVAGTSRDADRLDDLVTLYGEAVLPLTLDVADRDAAQEAVRAAAEHFGGLDVVVNNAGTGHFGMVEELSEQDIRTQMETNFYGTLWVTQAALAVMREQRGGHLLQVTSEGGVLAFPGIGAYHASKWAVEGLTQSLAQEVAHLGIAVTLIEPGPYGTDWLGASSFSKEIADYHESRTFLSSVPEVGDPAATSAAILALVDTAEPPLRLHLGHSIASFEADLSNRITTWKTWEDISTAAFGTPQALRGGPEPT